jgi:hypothetical protein
LAVRDVGIRERTLWRLPDETAARASEVLALDVGEPDLVNRCAKVCRKGNATAAGANFSEANARRGPTSVDSYGSSNAQSADSVRQMAVLGQLQ